MSSSKSSLLEAPFVKTLDERLKKKLLFRSQIIGELKRELCQLKDRVSFHRKKSLKMHNKVNQKNIAMFALERKKN